MLDFMTWPNLKKLTLVTIGNYFKFHHTVAEMNRADVYRHIKAIEGTGKLILVEKKPYEKMVWKYVDEFVGEGLAAKTRSSRIFGREHYWFTLTDKGNTLFDWVSLTLNLDKEKLASLLSEADRKKLSDSIKNLSQRIFPAPSAEDIKKALSEDRDESE